MIIDTTKTKIERDLSFANLWEQIGQLANDPDLVLTPIQHWSLPYRDLTIKDKEFLASVEQNDG